MRAGCVDYGLEDGRELLTCTLAALLATLMHTGRLS